MPEARGQSLSKVIQEAAGERLGVQERDRPAIYREVIQAAADTGLTYWIVLGLAGGIATLGLALDSSAVVIGAMLVSPLLAPVIGLALALAVGDTRTVVQTGFVVLASTAFVVATAAALTLLLPFHTVTVEISARTRPTTLDLAVAIFSGFVGAVVAVGRETRLSVAIPGVAIAVALIPPLAVAGFGIGSSLDFDLILGAMLLYGANLAGIILSGMVVFVLVGMHRSDVTSFAREWHANNSHELGWVRRVPGAHSLGVATSTWARMGLVGAFVIALGVPLSASLQEISREVRVERAISRAAENFTVDGRSSVLDRQVALGSAATNVRLRVITTDWFGQADEEAFELRASTLAGEPVQLYLEQLPATGADPEQLVELLPDRATVPSDFVPAPPPPPELITALRERVVDAASELSLPPDAALADLEIATNQVGEVTFRAVYIAPEPLSADAAAMLGVQLERALALPDLSVTLTHRLPEDPPPNHE